MTVYSHRLTLAAFAMLALGGCQVIPPSGPSIAVMPGKGKTLAQFQQDDYTCRGFAQSQISGQSAQASTNSALGTAAATTVLGTAAGALIGAAAGNAGTGAAVGAGAGLLGGAALGANQSGQSQMSLQQRYDIAYAQCMKTRGDIVPPM